jgi:2-octaprenyl-6-methoxyphenol hydroxylase
MGHLTPVDGRQAWPIVTQVAERITARRTALMAEAAHVVPPIGAQGLNMSLADLRALLDLAAARRGEIGEDGWLDAYARAREPDIRLRAFGIDALNRVSIGGLGPLRSLGIRAIHDVAPLRRGSCGWGWGSAREGRIAPGRAWAKARRTAWRDKNARLLRSRLRREPDQGPKVAILGYGSRGTPMR